MLVRKILLKVINLCGTAISHFRTLPKKTTVIYDDMFVGKSYTSICKVNVRLVCLRGHLISIYQQFIQDFSSKRGAPGIYESNSPYKSFNQTNPASGFRCFISTKSIHISCFFSCRSKSVNYISYPSIWIFCHTAAKSGLCVLKFI